MKSVRNETVTLAKHVTKYKYIRLPPFSMADGATFYSIHLEEARQLTLIRKNVMATELYTLG